MTDRTLKGKVAKLQELQTEIDALTAKTETLKDQIKDEMSARSVDELKAGDAVIRWKVITSSRFDAKAFKEAHSGLYAKFSQQTETRRFTLIPA